MTTPDRRVTIEPVTPLRFDEVRHVGLVTVNVAQSSQNYGLIMSRPLVERLTDEQTQLAIATEAKARAAKNGDSVAVEVLGDQIAELQDIQSIQY